MQHTDTASPSAGLGMSPIVAGPMVLTAGQVAQLLGLSEPMFRKKAAGLQALGFPGRLPGLAKWSRPAVVRWISSNGATTQQSGPPLDETLAIEVSELEKDYA
ncbi:MAG: hypothetical protein ACXWKQ_07325 [Reyranella sp.]